MILDILALNMGEYTPRPGVYHLTAAGETSWYGFAAAIFAGWARRGDEARGCRRSNASGLRIDCAKIERAFGIRLPPWQTSLELCLDELAAEGISRRLREHVPA